LESIWGEVSKQKILTPEELKNTLKWFRQGRNAQYILYDRPEYTKTTLDKYRKGINGVSTDFILRELREANIYIENYKQFLKNFSPTELNFYGQAFQDGIDDFTDILNQSKKELKRRNVKITGMGKSRCC